MSLSAVVVDAPADPIAIARLLAPRGGLTLLHRAGGRPGRLGWSSSFVAVEPVETVCDLLPPVELAPSARGADTRAGAPRWMGVLPYECARSLERVGWAPRRDARPPAHVSAPIWRRYGAVVEIDAVRGSVRVVGDDPSQITSLARTLREGRSLFRTGSLRAEPPRVELLAGDDPPEAHLARVERAKELIEAGELYQVNLARLLRFAIHGDALDLYAAMARHTAPPFGAYVDLGAVQIAACSPELFLSLDGARRVLTAPIKGTRPRGGDARADRLEIEELGKSSKEVAELTMILDVERNDLGRVSRPGSVKLLGPPCVETHPTLHHRGAVVQARLAAGATARDLVRAAFPSGSVTGAPKVRAMEVIAGLESARRGVYTGALGALAHDGTLQLAMGIRVLSVAGGEGLYHAGGGIVADSDPQAELEETRWKASQVERLLHGDAPRT